MKKVNEDGSVIYVCECGKEFDTSSEFSGHTTHCKIHRKTDVIYTSEAITCKYCKRRFNDPRAKGIHEKFCKENKEYQETKKLKEQEKLQIWINEKHTCAKCGKVMTEKFGSGKFCSRKCANSHNLSEETKQKISKNTSKYFKEHPELIKKIQNNFIRKFRIKIKLFINRISNFINKIIFHKNQIKTICDYCGKTIYISKYDYNRHKRHFCNGTCRNRLLNSTKEMGGFTRSRSNWEKQFCNLLDEYNIKYEANKRDLLPSKLEIDIFIPKYKMCIELNGIYHYSTKPYNGKIKPLLQRKIKDLKKKNESIKNGYKFIVFRDDKIKDKEKFFRNFIETNLI